jgi:ornithine cyclodeaminase
MRIYSRAEVAEKAPYRAIIEALRAAFRGTFHTPPRHHHPIARPNADTASLLLMPAWTEMREGEEKGYVGLKTVMVVTDNAERGQPTIQAQYALFSGTTGETLALMDGKEITARRTACASALAADYLARPEARTHLMIGTGTLAPHVMAAHAAIRPLTRMLVWSREPAKARALAARTALPGIEIVPTESLAEAAAEADIISSATTSREPILRGAWVKPGTHIDIMGAFRPDMRETDGAAVGKARVFVDTREGAQTEAGDLLQAEAEGHFAMSRVAGDLADLARGAVKGRASPGEITLFKSCGTAIEDLATAILIYEGR